MDLNYSQINFIEQTPSFKITETKTYDLRPTERLCDSSQEVPLISAKKRLNTSFDGDNEYKDNYMSLKKLGFNSDQDEVNFYLSLSPTREQICAKMTSFDPPERFNFGDEEPSSSKKSSNVDRFLENESCIIFSKISTKLDSYDEDYEDRPRRLTSELKEKPKKASNPLRDKIISEFLNEHGLTYQSFIQMSKSDAYISTTIRNLVKVDQIISTQDMKATRTSAAERFANEYPYLKSKSRSRTPGSKAICNKSKYEELKECSYKKLVELSFNIHDKMKTHINFVISECKKKEAQYNYSLNELKKANKSLTNSLKEEREYSIAEQT